MRWNRRLSLAFLGVWTATFVGLTGVGQEAARFRMEGSVADESGRPVNGAVVSVLIESERSLASKVLRTTTDASGRYALGVPQGHAKAWTLKPPAGYVPTEKIGFEGFATTPEQPVFKKDYQVGRGVPWKIVAQAPAAALPLTQTFVSAVQQKGAEFAHAFTELDAQGNGDLTLPDVGGEFTVNCGDVAQQLSAPVGMKISFEKGFRGDKVVSTKALEAGGMELRDESGLTATVHGTACESGGGVATLIIPLAQREVGDYGTIVGRVLDATGQAVAGAAVEAVFHSGGGSAMTGLEALSDDAGRFRLSIPRSQEGQEEQKVSLVVIAEGHGGLDTNERKVDFSKSSAFDVGDVRLRRSSSIAVRVVGPDGEPLVGAVVEPLGSYAARGQVTRTGEDGLCTLKDLAPGVQPLMAQFGTLSVNTKMPIAEGENELLVLKLARPRTAEARVEAREKKALSQGTQAPEWDVVEWTDGQERKLADFRGKVVVVDFWGTWCGPCIQAIGALKNLHERYHDRGVVFLGIHTAGTDMSLIKRVMKQEQWESVTGLDRGDDIVSGKTTLAYAVEGFPTLIVIDREGKVAFNSGDVPEREQYMKQMAELAKSIGVRWPIGRDATEEEIRATVTRLSEALYGREIERALRAGR